MKKEVIFFTGGMVAAYAFQKLWKKFNVSERISKKVAELRNQTEKKDNDNFENPQ